MRILLSAYSCEPDRGSELEMGWREVEELAKTNAQVTVVTKTTSMDAINRHLSTHPLPNVRFWYYELPAWLQRVKRHLLGAQLHCYLWEVGLFFFLLKRCRRGEFDLAHKITIGSYRFPSFAWYFAKRFIWGPFCSGERFPLKFLAVYSNQGKMQELARLLMQRLSLWDPFVLTALHKADLLITLTQDTKDMLPGFARRKAFVITRQHISVAPTAFDYVETDHPLAGDTARGSVRLLYIGRLLEWKGLMLVLYALDKLRGTGDYRFTIIGQGPAKNFYQAYAEKRGLDVVFLSPTGIPRRKLSSYYLGHDLFAFPSLHGTAGYVMLEAQLHNLPVLMLDITAPPSFERFERDIIITTKKRTVLQVVDSVATAISSFVRQEKTSIPASKQ